MKQTTLRPYGINANKNITFPVGTTVAVKNFYGKVGLDKAVGKHKERGRSLNSLIQALVSYRLTENLSINKASDWINRKDVLREFCLSKFEQRTLFRALEIIGSNKEEILHDIQNSLFSKYDFEHTDINMDWTSFTLWGDKCKKGKYGYSRDHRPDKKQVTVGLCELREPINIPIGMTVMPGNTNDQTHFKETFRQVSPKLRDGSLVTYDKGANSKDNNELVLGSKMKYLTSKKLI